MPIPHVLLFEDNAVLATLLSELFAEEDIVVTHCASVAALRAGVQRDPLAVIVTDSLYPEDHEHLSDRQRADLLALSATRPVSLTSGRQWASKLTPGSLGRTVVLLKPYDIDHLVAAVRGERSSRGATA